MAAELPSYKEEAVDATAGTLLIVEDDILSATALGNALEDAGFQVLDLASRPREAMVTVRACRPDLALVNINLHGRNDGIGLAAKLTALGIPVLFISGQVSRARSAQTVAVGSLPKPYNPADMVQAVRYLLGHLDGDECCPRPPQLEVFDRPPAGAVPGTAQTAAGPAPSA